MKSREELGGRRGNFEFEEKIYGSLGNWGWGMDCEFSGRQLIRLYSRNIEVSMEKCVAMMSFVFSWDVGSKKALLK